MLLTPFPFYDTIQEWPLGGERGPRRRNEAAQILSSPAPDGADLTRSTYSLSLTRILEGGSLEDSTVGFWPINHSRVARHDGELPAYIGGTELVLRLDWSPEQREKALTLRSHHYSRLRNATEIARVVSTETPVQIAIEITHEWNEPHDGLGFVSIL